MSATAATQEQDKALLIQSISRPVILEKLARDWNIHARTVEQEDQLMELADLVVAAQQQDVIKKASVGEDPFLTRTIGAVRQAIGQPVVSQAMFKEAADNILSDAAIKAAASRYLDHLEAEAVKATQVALAK
jgi:hypothetical protein